MSILMNLILAIPFLFGILLLFFRFGGSIGSYAFAKEQKDHYWAADLFALFLIGSSSFFWITQLFGHFSFNQAAAQVGGPGAMARILTINFCGFSILIPTVLMGFFAVTEKKAGMKIIYFILCIIFSLLSLGIIFQA